MKVQPVTMKLQTSEDKRYFIKYEDVVHFQ